MNHKAQKLGGFSAVFDLARLWYKRFSHLGHQLFIIKPLIQFGFRAVPVTSTAWLDDLITAFWAEKPFANENASYVLFGKSGGFSAELTENAVECQGFGYWRHHDHLAFGEQW